MTQPNTDTTDETPEKATRRSALKRELDAFAKLVEILRPLSIEQRDRLISASTTILRDTQP